MHFLLIYTLASDYLERRVDFRGAHLTLAWQSHHRGELILGGALPDPVDTAVLLFRADAAGVAEQFAEADPSVRNGLRASLRARRGRGAP